MSRLTVLDLRGDRTDPRNRLPRPLLDLGAVREGVERSLHAVRDRGDEALRDLTSTFDHLDVEEVVVPDAVLQQAVDDLDPEMRATLERSIERVRWFHERAKPQAWEDERDGMRMGVWFNPIRRVGAYVPGGLCPLPSSAIMTVVPAQVAGVEEVVLCSPPTGLDADGNRTGWPDGTILATAKLLEVDRVIRVGGAQAIAAMAYGTESVPRCDEVVGPGNLYVALAKQQLVAEGRIGTEGYAGPTEVAIVADGTADPRHLAADLIGQAEHDELVTSLLITPDEELVAPVQEQVELQLARTKHVERIATALEDQGTIVLVDDIDHAIEVAEAFAAEHLEVHTDDARKVAEAIRYAGTTFIGAATPVTLGDYAAGPNHTLPTSGTARFSGGLTTSSFLVAVNFLECDDDSLRFLAEDACRLADAEDLPAHRAAVEVRLDPDA